MNFFEAMQKLEQGKKVRHVGWEKDLYLEHRDGRVRSNFGCTVISLVWTISSVVWEEFDERVKFSQLDVGQNFKYCGQQFIKLLSPPSSDINSFTTGDYHATHFGGEYLVIPIK
jgi:hypothetical protein